MSRPPLRRRSWGWIVWMLLVGAGIFFGRRWMIARRSQLGINVRVQKVRRGTVRELISTSGTGRLSAPREVTLRAEMGGTVQVLHHHRGDLIRSGDPLVTFQSLELQDRLQIAKASVDLARAQLAQAEVGARIARTNAQRAGRLMAQGVTPPAEAESLQAQADSALKSAATARASIAQGLANVKLAETALAKSVVRAPFDGQVLTTTIEMGETAAPGTPLATIAERGTLHVDGELDEADVGRIALGMKSEVALDAFGTAHFAGTVLEIAPGVSRDLRGNRSVALRVGVDPDSRLKVGMSADVDIIVARHDGVLWVAPNAVMGRGTDRSVYVVENHVARKRTVSVGVSTWEAVEITSGANEGDRVIVTLSAQDLEDGAQVKEVEEEATTGARGGAR